MSSITCFHDHFANSKFLPAKKRTPLYSTRDGRIVCWARLGISLVLLVSVVVNTTKSLTKE